MTTGEGDNPRNGETPRGDERRSERIGVGGGDDSVSRIQLAARWAEAYGTDGESLTRVLKRFRLAYDYLDAVIHGVEPPDLEPEVPEPRPAASPAYSAPASPASPEPSPQPSPWAAPTSPETGAPPAERDRPWP